MRNHPLVRVRQAAPVMGAVCLDVGNQTAYLSPDEALTLRADLTKLLVLQGHLEAQP